jgi:hypothetical protein
MADKFAERSKNLLNGMVIIIGQLHIQMEHLLNLLDLKKIKLFYKKIHYLVVSFFILWYNNQVNLITKDIL